MQPSIPSVIRCNGCYEPRYEINQIRVSDLVSGCWNHVYNRILILDGSAPKPMRSGWLIGIPGVPSRLRLDSYTPYYFRPNNKGLLLGESVQRMEVKEAGQEAFLS